MRNQAISEVYNTITRKSINRLCISSKTLQRYILYLVPLVEKKVAADIPSKFGISFDGLTDSRTHFVAIFATFGKKNVLHEVLLAISTLGKEYDFGVEQYVWFLEFTLDGKTFDNVIAFTGGNCNVNKTYQQIVASR